MRDKRCTKCNKLLFKMSHEYKGQLEIQCPKCKTKHLYIEALETQRIKVS